MVIGCNRGDTLTTESSPSIVHVLLYDTVYDRPSNFTSLPRYATSPVFPLYRRLRGCFTAREFTSCDVLAFTFAIHVRLHAKIRTGGGAFTVNGSNEEASACVAIRWKFRFRSRIARCRAPSRPRGGVSRSHEINSGRI